MKTIFKYYLSFILLLNVFVLNAQNWKPIGPYNRINYSGYANGQGSGRVISLAFHPLYGLADPALGGAINKTVFAGSPYGGLWITKDDGNTWANTDVQYPNLTTDFLPACGVADIVVDYSNPTTLYASVCYTPSITNSTKPLPGNGIVISHLAVGIYKYTPATGWVAKYSFPYGSGKSIMQLTIDPSNSSNIFACTSDGVMRSTDGGNTWAIVLSSGTDQPFRNLIFDPVTPTYVYACGQEVFKSVTSGASWSGSPISSFYTIPGNTGTSLVNMVAKNSTTLYASVVYQTSGGLQYKFYKYNGSSWTALAMFPIHFGWSYDRLPLALLTNGGNDYIFAGQEDVHRYNVSTGTWATVSGYAIDMHGDIHDIVMSPDNTSLWVANDGGVSKATTNLYSSTPGWVTVNNGLNIATLFDFAGAEKNPERFLTGEFDNGNSYVNNADESNYALISWEGRETCDGAEKAISYTDPDDWISREQMYAGAFIYRNTSGNPAGYSTSGTSLYSPPPPGIFEDFHSSKPIVRDINFPNIVYRGANELIRSMDNGVTSDVVLDYQCFPSVMNWYSQIFHIAVGPNHPDVLYATVDNWHSLAPKGPDVILKTTTARTQANTTCSPSPGCYCGAWTNISPPWPGGVTLAQLNDTRITSTTVSDKDPNRIWASFSYSQYTSTPISTFNYRVMMYDGTTWTDWGTGLPDCDVNYVLYERGSNDGIYAATDRGVYYRNKTMSSWIQFGPELPHAKGIKLEINYFENTIRLGTVGRGIWKSPLYCSMTGPLVKTNCLNCNSPSDDFWEGTSVTINATTTLNTYKSDMRARDFVKLAPPGNGYTLLDPAGNPNDYYYLYIHGCDAAGNSFRMGQEEAAETEDVELTEAKEITVYPNPNEGQFILSVENQSMKNIYVYDILGKIIYQKTDTSDEQFHVDISKEKKGLYLVKVVIGDDVKTVRIINQ